MRRFLVSIALLAGFAASALAADIARTATIFYSAAPWDGAAYAMNIPLDAAIGAERPVLRVNIWGNPEFAQPTTLRFSGKENAGGGPDRGGGRVSYQAVLDKSWPQPLAGTLTFDVLQKDKPVRGSYDLATLDGKRSFKGSFSATWGNAPMRMIR